MRTMTMRTRGRTTGHLAAAAMTRIVAILMRLLASATATAACLVPQSFFEATAEIAGDFPCPDQDADSAHDGEGCGDGELLECVLRVFAGVRVHLVELAGDVGGLEDGEQSDRLHVAERLTTHAQNAEREPGQREDGLGHTLRTSSTKYREMNTAASVTSRSCKYTSILSKLRKISAVLYLAARSTRELRSRSNIRRPNDFRIDGLSAMLTISQMQTMISMYPEARRK